MPFLSRLFPSRFVVRFCSFLWASFVLEDHSRMWQVTVLSNCIGPFSSDFAVACRMDLGSGRVRLTTAALALNTWHQVEMIR